MTEELSTKDIIINDYIEFVKANEKQPTYADLLENFSHKSEKIKYHFGNIETLHDYMLVHHAEVLSNIFSLQQSLFKKTADIYKKINNSKTFFITTAVADKKADTNFLAAIDTFCALKNASILVLPCENITNTFNRDKGVFDKAFNNQKYTFISDDVSLNTNLHLCSIQVSAKQIKPTTGLLRFGSREGSYIFSAPKQFLEFSASGNDRTKAYAVMTPGACTINDYSTKSNQLMSKRTEYIATQDHCIGGIIVEIIDDHFFHFRHVQADENGNFIDLGTQYRSNGKVKQVALNVVAEPHFGSHDVNLFSEIEKFCRSKQTKRIFVHDGFDAITVNHHVEDNSIAKYNRNQSKNINLQRELLNYRDCLNSLTLFFDEVVVVKSNHDEFLDRYLKEGRYINDVENHRFALELAPLVFDSPDEIMKNSITIAAKDTAIGLSPKVKFLSRHDSYKIGGREMAAHGDMGMNGTMRPSLNSLEKIYGKCVVGHNHSAAIQRDVFRIGTASNLDLGYNKGPSSWTQGIGLVYENGTAQLLNFINGSLC